MLHAMILTPRVVRGCDTISTCRVKKILFPIAHATRGLPDDRGDELLEFGVEVVRVLHTVDQCHRAFAAGTEESPVTSIYERLLAVKHFVNSATPGCGT